ncbi:hypothetical protein HY768_01780 [candidate division TA06 bacterium]|uniref:Nucleotidyltransferase family protein n=1 Tax=candidate division TA06 bacterium TaxID=2250710 RepID=A0A933I9T9_UNCT6|nr:hypothetical protein [candidate division TA06 bacterium]
MTHKKFYQLIAGAGVDVVGMLLALLKQTDARYCVVGGLAVNAYAEPVVSLDLDLIVAADKIDSLVAAARLRRLKVQRFEHSVNLSPPGSQLRIQLQTGSRYQPFLARAASRRVLGYAMKVARIEDVLQGKLWAYADVTRRPSKRQKDLADIMRLVETRPGLKKLLPTRMTALMK